MRGSFHLPFAIAVLWAVAPAHAAPWCASSNIGTTCGFYTFEQCRQNVSGVGGLCMRNPAEPETKDVAPSRNRAVRDEPKKPAAPRPEPQQKKAAPLPTASAPPQPAALPPTTPVVVMPGPAVSPPIDGIGGARRLIAEGKYETALAALTTLEETPDAAALTGFVYGRLGRPADAKAWYEKALAANPNHLPALSYYGMLLVEQGDLPKAQAGLEKIKQICGNTGCYEYAALQAVIATKKR